MLVCRKPCTPIVHHEQTMKAPGFAFQRWHTFFVIEAGVGTLKQVLAHQVLAHQSRCWHSVGTPKQVLARGVGTDSGGWEGGQGMGGGEGRGGS